MSFIITGTGSFLPEPLLTNADLEKMVETSDDWIRSRTGIETRHIAHEMSVVDLSVQAARKALSQSGRSPEDIRCIICATISTETLVPSLASCVQREIGAFCPSFDINAACSGFLYALRVAMGFVQDGPVLVIGAEKLSRLTDWDDRSTCILFGDAAGAAVLEAGDGLEHIFVNGYPDVENLLGCEGVNAGLEDGALRKAVITMKGQEVYKFATQIVPSMIREACEAVGIEMEEIDWFLPHQANKRIIDSASHRIKVPLEKFYINIQNVGNTSAASIPVALDEMNRAGLLKRGDRLAIMGFGGGLTAGCALMKW
ncbi:MAG: beta-ketoacyl-ACP synthase III [Christensenellales bacterium]